MGFGEGPFGSGKFGRTSWTYRVLYQELPQRMILQDKEAGGFYEKFVLAVAEPVDNMRDAINGSGSMKDPLSIRADLLRFLTASFGMETDTAEPEDFQRSAADLYARFLLIKGRPEAFVALAKVHGFEAQVFDLWLDGNGYTTTQPGVVGEVVGEVQ